MSSVGEASILVVDDNEDNRDMLSRRLKRQGYRIALAENGHQALDMVSAEKFDLVVLDIMMPGISGLDVLKTLRNTYSVADLPIIMATAKDQSEDVVTALGMGANDYVTKPLDFPVALARIQIAIILEAAFRIEGRIPAHRQPRSEEPADRRARHCENGATSRAARRPDDR